MVFGHESRRLGRMSIPGFAIRRMDRRQEMAGKSSYRAVLFPTYIAALLWAGLFLREQRLRTLLPLRASMLNAN